MKLLKLSLLAILLSFVVMSCSDDSTNPDDDGGGGIGTTKPNSKGTILTSVDGEEVDSRVLEIKDGNFIPSNFHIGGDYDNAAKKISFLFTEVSGAGPSYSCQLSSRMDKIEVGTYNYTKGDSKLELGVFIYHKLSKQPYLLDVATLIINKIQYIGTGKVGINYISGTLLMDLYDENKENPNVIVNIAFQDLPITNSHTGF